MNSCFEKFVTFKRIMSHGLNRIAGYKNQFTFSNSIKITWNNEIFSYFTKLYECGGNFQSSYETKKSLL